jgi:phosphopantothenate-cysteine ligase
MNVVVTGGGTIAPIDDVRHIANVSSGRFAAAITEACLARGATVWHVHAPTAQLPLLRSARFDLDAADPAAEHARLSALRDDWLAVRDRLHLRPLRRGGVKEYAETLRATLIERPIDVAFLAMAVSDFEPEPVAGKISSDVPSITIRAGRNPKVIRSVRDWSPDVFLVGFKLLSRVEPAELIREAVAAGIKNRTDLTVANDLQSLREGRHTVHLVRPGHPAETIGPGPSLADDVVGRVFELVAGRAG